MAIQTKLAHILGRHMTGPAVDAIPNTALLKTHCITWESTMDAAEDRDVKLQRASGDLVTEFSAKLPSLLWRSQETPLRTPRRWAQVTKTEKLVSLVRPHYKYSVLCVLLFLLCANNIRSLSLFRSGLNS